jgi:hypothetical protein
MENFGKFCAVLLVVFLNLFSGGFVFYKLYQWFLITTFNAPEIRLIEAMGIMLIIGYINPSPKKEDQELYDQFIDRIVLYLLYLGVGFVFYQFI